MRKFTSLALILAFILSLFTTHADAAASQTKAKVTASILNVRSKPSTSSSIIDKLKKDAAVTIKAESNGWSQVTLKKGTGWVSSKYLKKISVSASSATKTGYVTASSLNLREKATTSSKSVLLLKKGNKVTILKTSGSWYYIQAAGSKKGYVSKSYISTKVPVPSSAPKAKTVYGYVNASSFLTLREKASTTSKSLMQLKRGTKITILKTSGSWHNAKAPNGKTGWVLKSYVASKAPAPAPAKTVYAYVNTDSLNLREKATTSSKSLMTLKKGQQVKVLDPGSTWSYIQASNGTKGWLSKKYLSATAPVTVQPSVKKGYVTTNDLNVRENAGTSYKILAKLNTGAEVQVYSSKGDWLNIKTSSGIKGWVHKAYITFTKINDNNLSLPSSFPSLRGKKIMIDPGHGGYDVGAVGAGYGTYEKNVTLSTALILAQKLRAAGAKVYMTRSTDTAIALTSRPQLSNNYLVDAFVSIHYNSGPSAGTGIETFYQPGSVYSGLASLVQQGVVKYTGFKSRGIAGKNLQVLRTNKRPCVLVELGFLSNKSEEQIVRTSAHQQKAAAGIAEGLNSYFR
ncbi:SH3 domain-containing protein [Fictibacillus sp. FJAT-27399]|uniref:SH3 domain-containing protein n=1 Tax=Fictibacillus sp. FJAT-27399 TaxID=1729689 RepID=UPI0007827810|nr:SH3 domain-containing protein [Fictibacillus sp. FJAT-27399]